MYSTTDQEKELLNKNNPNPPQTLKDFKELSDRELLERQTLYLSKIEKANIRIVANLQFWFYLTVIAIVIGVLIIVSEA